jgi:hypothetical protein
MLDGLPHVQVVENGWQSWPQFRQSVAHMHLLLQPSYTESFNMITADGVAEGVPSVVSHAIDWTTDQWKAMMDDVLDNRPRRPLFAYRPLRATGRPGRAQILKSWQRF